MGASTYVTDISAAVAGAASVDIQPAAGDAYCIEEVSGDAAFVGGIPDLSLNLIEAGFAVCILRIDPTTAVQKNRKLEIYISNTCYLRITNTAVGAQNVGWFGKQVNANNIRSQVLTAPNGGSVDFQPPVGEIWKVTEISGETMGAANHPNVTMYLTDGVLVLSALCNETQNCKFEKLWNLYLTNANYLNVAPIAAADNDVGLSIMRVEGEAFCGILDCVGSATIDIQPAAGQQAVVTEISAETWAGIAPAGTPDITVSLWDGVSLSDVMEAGSVLDSLIAFRHMELRIDNDNFLRVTEVSTGDNQIAWSGMVEREY